MLARKIIQTDFCVIGGGMAGICAAIAAAREGAKVVLMHERPVLGGNASSEIRMWVCGAHGENNRETGILEEIALENCYRNPTKNYYIWDTVLYDFVKREENITLLLNCTCMDAETEEGGFADGRTIRIKKVSGYQMTTQTFFDVLATNYADCSGDSVLAPLTGAEFRIGRESAEEFGEETHVKEHDNLTMGNSCLIQGRQTHRPVSFTPPLWSTKLGDKDFLYRCPDLYNPYENFWYLELGGNRDTIADAEEITSELVPLALGTWDYIKNSGKFDAENWELDFLGFLAGKRESRRMVGEYIIKQQDISGNRIFEDTIAFGGWTLDDHFPDGFYHNGVPNTHILTPSPYCIPYRALYSKNVENLFFAGRNISMTHMAMSSIRVMATCALLGQAVGTAAAIAVKHNITPHGVYLNQLENLQQTLMRADCFLPHFQRNIGTECKTATIKNGNEHIRDTQDRAHTIYQSKECGICVQNGVPVSYVFEQPVFISRIHLTFDSDLNRSTLPDNPCERMHMTRSNTYLDSPDQYVPKTLCKAYRLCGYCDGEETVLLEVSDNRKRAYDIPVEKKLTGISLTILENWGETEKTNLFSYDFQ
ncbi:MAG: FAD-dependent oxidoreductase [Ruminococcaceae bacterium]|nr:FAD-dependent oxidoreductase [Oscillospiraceae bacterium]